MGGGCEDGIMEEKSYWQGKKSRKSFAGNYMISGLIFLIALMTGTGTLSGVVSFVDMFSLYIAIALACVGVSLLTMIEVKRTSVKYSVTSRRVVKETGIFNKKKDYIPYQMVEKISVNELWYQRLLNIGDIKVDTGEANFYLESIDRPEKVEEIIRSAMSNMVVYAGNARQNQNNYKNPARNSYPQSGNQKRRMGNVQGKVSR